MGVLSENQSIPTAQDQEDWQAQKVADLKGEAEEHRRRRSSSNATTSEPVRVASPVDEAEEHRQRRSASAPKPGPKSQRARKAAAAKKGGSR